MALLALVGWFVWRLANDGRSSAARASRAAEGGVEREAPPVELRPASAPEMGEERDETSMRIDPRATTPLPDAIAGTATLILPSFEDPRAGLEPGGPRG